MEPNSLKVTFVINRPFIFMFARRYPQPTEHCSRRFYPQNFDILCDHICVIYLNV